MGFEQTMTRNLSGEMVIEIAYPRPNLQGAEQGFPIAVQRDIENSEFVAWFGGHAREQGYVALDAGYQRGCARIGEPELVQRAQSVGVAIEDVIESHAVPPAADRQSPAWQIANTP